MHKGKDAGTGVLASDQNPFSSPEWLEAARDAALQLWRSSMLTLSETMPLVPKQISEPHRRGIKLLVEEFPTRPAPNQIEQRRQQTTEVLKSYGQQMGGFIESQEREAKAVLTSVAQLTETLSGFDQRYSVRLQGITKKLRLLATSNDLSEIRQKLSAEVNALEKCLEEQQRDTKAAVGRLSQDMNASELRRQRRLPGPGAQQASDSLLQLDRAVSEWPRYCLVRYDFRDRQGSAPDENAWKGQCAALSETLPERMGHQVSTVSPSAGVLLAAVHCQLLEYAGVAEAMEKSLSSVSGWNCQSRVVEPLRGEAMREAMARLEKAV